MQKPIITLSKVKKVREQAGLKFELFIPEINIIPGKFIAIVGDSGCGKSTFLDMLALISHPHQAETFSYHFSEQHFDIATLWRLQLEHKLAHIRRQYLGYILQTGGLLPFLSIEENVLLPSAINGKNSVNTMKNLAQKIGIENLLAKKPQYVSGGQRQRAAILRALSHNPPLILADEPTAAVDKKKAREIVAQLQTLALELNTTILMVTHDRDLIENIADHYITFNLEEISSEFTRSTVTME